MITNSKPLQMSKKAIATIFICLKFQVGIVVTGLSGSQGGTVASKNRGGFYFRGKGAIINHNTSRQHTSRQRFAIASARWATLTQLQRDSFITMAPTFTRIDVFGDNRPLSGSQLYNKLNGNTQKINQSFVDVCPVPVSPAAINMTAVTISIAGPSIEIALPAAVPAGYTGYLSLSPVLSAGIQFNKNNYKFVRLLVLADTALVDVTSEYEAIYGITWQGSLGSQIMAKLEIVENASGIPSSITNQFGIISA